MNEAELRGINLDQLRTESPTHPKQVKIRREHEARANIYWKQQKFANEPAAPKKNSIKYVFTAEQVKLVEAIIERKRK